MNNITLIIIITGILVFSYIGYVAYGASVSTIDNSGRREYGYCPISPETMLSRAQFEINGCPLIRVYITNWNQLTVLDQQTIDSQLRSAGFKDIGEFDSRVK